MTIFHCRIWLLSEINIFFSKKNTLFAQNDNKEKMSTKSENVENGDGAQNQNEANNKSSILAQMLFTGDSGGLANILNQPVQPVPLQQPVPRKRSLDTDSENDNESGEDTNTPESSNQFWFLIIYCY